MTLTLKSIPQNTAYIICQAHTQVQQLSLSTTTGFSISSTARGGDVGVVSLVNATSSVVWYLRLSSGSEARVMVHATLLTANGMTFTVFNLITVHTCTPITAQSDKVWPQGYKTLFMLNSAEHEIFSANKYENANSSWHFHIHLQRKFQVQLCLASKNLQFLVFIRIFSFFAYSVEFAPRFF